MKSANLIRGSVSGNCFRQQWKFGSGIGLRKIVSDKQFGGMIVKSLKPEALRRSVEVDLEYGHDDLNNNIPALFDYVVQKVERFEEVFRASKAETNRPRGGDAKEFRKGVVRERKYQGIPHFQQHQPNQVQQIVTNLVSLIAPIKQLSTSGQRKDLHGPLEMDA